MKLQILLLILLFPILGLAQSRVITNNSDTLLIKEHIIWGDKMNYINIETNKRESILIENIKQFDGELYKRQQKKITELNPNVIITKSQTGANFFMSEKMESSEFSPGDYLIKAGKSYQAATALYLVGAGVAAAGVSLENDAVSITGGAIGVAGLILQVIGHSHLVKSGYKLNQQGLTLKLSESGTGLAFVF